MKTITRLGLLWAALVVLALAVVVLCATRAVSVEMARIGDTLEQCDQRYGKAVEGGDSTNGVSSWRTYSKGGYQFLVVFSNNGTTARACAESITYSKCGEIGRTSLSKREIKRFLSGNSSGGAWKTIDTGGFCFNLWKLDVAQRQASYDSESGRLSIWTEAAVKAAKDIFHSMGDDRLDALP